MGEIQKIELKGIRVLTTKQIAEAYETTEEKIRWNFKYNRDKYIPGKHYIVIEGEELREMKRECEFHTLFKQAKSVCFCPKTRAFLLFLCGLRRKYSNARKSQSGTAEERGRGITERQKQTSMTK